ncbi:MAG: deoxyribose-phosphate aldolase [Candidatus Cryptobacteroides sp.]|nr:deoxyribose-phosphate aldolase [Candidatus Cryptobacteroides sp.]
MIDYLSKYGYTPKAEEIDAKLAKISQNVNNFMTEDVLKKCFSMLDLTTLKSDDTPSSVSAFVEKVNSFAEDYPDWPLPASVCVYSNFASVVDKVRRKDFHITVVSACFPTSQSFLEVKLLECEKAVEAGADEVDIVLALNAFLDSDFEKAYDEIAAVRKCIDDAAAKQGRQVHLKVILETGLLQNPEIIARASFLAMEAGADFIKTSTGKVSVNATPAAAFVMCQCIAAYYAKTGKKIGFKPAGGISTAEDAVCYYLIVSNVLGEEWLNRDLFRFGVSRVANSILSAAEQKTIKYF